MSMKGKKIVLGITGSIAAYKAAILIRGLIKKGAEVQVVITPAGKEFITPITLSALTSEPVISEFFAQRDGTWNSHVDFGLWADAMIIAPATASTIVLQFFRIAVQLGFQYFVCGTCVGFGCMGIFQILSAIEFIGGRQGALFQFQSF